MGGAEPDEPSDVELVAAVRRGDADAADRLVRRHFRAAYAVALARLRHPADAEDVCQDAFVRALERIDDCRDPSRFVHWLLRIVRNRAHNLGDWKRVRHGPSLDDVVLPGTGDACGDAERRELRERLRSALADLPEVQREVVLLKDMEGWGHAAIAAALGISEVMSRQHLFVARRALRARMAEWGRS